MNSHELLAICSKHPEFDRGLFMDEGRAMRAAGVIDKFYSLCDRFLSSGASPGSINRCNSVIAWWAGMTTKKPDGPFSPSEKMTAARISPPDVDTDFDYFRRDEVYRYLVETYRDERTCNIGTYNELKAASTIRGVGKVLDIGGDWVQVDGAWTREGQDRKPGPKTLRRVDELTKMVSGVVDTIENACKLNPALEMEMKKHPGLLEACKNIQGRVSHAGVHPAGIVVSSKVIREFVPLHSSRGTVCSQYDMGEIEALGLLKFDILALKTLSVIETTLKMLRDRKGLAVDIDALDPTDQEVFDLLNAGFTKGIFQMEGGRFTDMIKDIHISSFNDMVAANAIYRPGPLGAKVDVQYAALKHGRIPVVYDHPSLQPVLENTYGLMIYQEQIMMVSRILCGFTSSEADKLRKVIGKKIKEELPVLHAKFVKRAVENGVQEELAERIWQKVEFFGNYGFNRSHAACYSYIAYQTAWLKRYHRHEFMACLLTSEVGDEKKVSEYISEARRLGIRVCAPHINRSTRVFEIEEEGDLRAPLTVVKGVGDKAVSVIIAARGDSPFSSLRDFVVRTSSREVTTKMVELLIDAGCFSCFDVDRSALKRKLEALKKEIKTRKYDPSAFSGGAEMLFSIQ